MEPVTMGLIAMGVIGGAKALGGLIDDMDTTSKKAALMRKGADLSHSALEETLRRREGAQTQVLSSTKAQAASTGFASDSKSFVDYLSGMAAEFNKQNETTRTYGMEALDLQRKAADLTDTNLAAWLNFGGDLLGTGRNVLAAGKFG